LKISSCYHGSSDLQLLWSGSSFDVRELDRIIEKRGKPKMIVSDNGSDFTSNAILQWTDEVKVEWHYIAPGKPIQNAFIESFMYRRLRGRKMLSASRGHHSGAFMYSTFDCDRYRVAGPDGVRGSRPHQWVALECGA
jgi:transposase InsO family protein